jgi:hypothetical protein
MTELLSDAELRELGKLSAIPSQTCARCGSTGQLPSDVRPSYGLAIKPCPDCHNWEILDTILGLGDPIKRAYAVKELMQKYGDVLDVPLVFSEKLSALADAVADAVLYGEQDDRDEQLLRLADVLDRFTIPKQKQSRLAHYAYRTPSGVPLWLRSTAALCRLVQIGEEQPGELISRLVALSWGLGDTDTRYEEVCRADDADLIRRYDSLTFGVVKALQVAEQTPAETREGRKLTAWLVRLAGTGSDS